MANPPDPMTAISSVDLETAPCSLCGSNAADPWYEFPPFAAVRCRKCGLRYLSKRLREPAMLKRYEDAAYYHGEGYENYDEQERSLTSTYRRFVRTLRVRGLTGGRLLEIGCGFGTFLAASAGAFDYRAGTEISAEGRSRAARVADVVYQGGVDVIPDGEKFDLIVAMQVVEHVYEPIRWLTAIRERLRASGSLILATPDAGGLLRKVTGRRWPSFKIPEHVVYFDERTLSALFSKAGFVATRLPLLHSFPVGLLSRRVGVRVPAAIAPLPVPIPTTTLAMMGRQA
jgi:2-polyprenyl-3-methyl-5-hydroxy-6-metoxy-1,4-benzoquinol methylase